MVPTALTMFLARGGAQQVDGIAYHLYSDGAANLIRQLDEARAVMRSQGVTAMPLWNTEAGVENYPIGQAMPAGLTVRLTEASAAERMAQLLITAASLGLARYYYYAWDNDLSGMVDRAHHGRPRRPAYEQVQRWLTGLQLEAAEPSALTRAWTVAAAAGGQRYLFAWSDSGEPHRIRVPTGSRVAGVEWLLPPTPEAAPGGRAVDVGGGWWTLAGGVCRLTLQAAGTAPAPGRRWS